MDNKIGTQIDFNRCILWGDKLRILLNSNHISYGEINELLREKGIFIDSSDKSVTVPLLSSCLLTPSEFTKLITRSFSRESTEKEKTYTFTLKDEKSDISEILTTDFDNYASGISLPDGLEFIEAPSIFIKENQNIRIEYKVKKTDFSQDWIEQEIVFSGGIEFLVENQKIRLTISATHTSKDTDKINSKLLSCVTRQLHSHNAIQEKEANTIKFQDFNNRERIAFFLILSTSLKNFTFKEYVDLEIIRDDTAGSLPNEPEISWMSGKVRKIRIDGQNLNEINFIKTEKYRDFYYLTKTNATFEYNVGANSGSCTVCFSFSNKSNRNDDYSNSEFLFSIVRFSHQNEKSNNKIKEFICQNLRELQELAINRINHQRT